MSTDLAFKWPAAVLITGTHDWECYPITLDDIWRYHGILESNFIGTHTAGGSEEQCRASQGGSTENTSTTLHGVHIQLRDPVDRERQLSFPDVKPCASTNTK